MTGRVLEQTFQYIILYTVIVVPIFSLPFLHMDYYNYVQNLAQYYYVSLVSEHVYVLYRPPSPEHDASSAVSTSHR